MSEEKTYGEFLTDEFRNVDPDYPSWAKMSPKCREYAEQHGNAIAAEAIRRHESSLLKVVEEMELAAESLNNVFPDDDSNEWLTDFDTEEYEAMMAFRSALASLKKWREGNNNL